MGEVYRARDTKLGRSVAIKVLPDAFAADPDRVPRFEREAKLLASLNHPHIAALYGMEEAPAPGPGQPPPHFLIMELVEGETLCERLERGALPVGEALAIAIQIADALETAHEQGVVHRDLKPANIKITPDDKVKVLDFGLAKAMDSSPAAASPANSPTLSVMATQAGIIMGTAAYMSPEQAKGTATDRRSDVFAFGTVLYELLSGRQPFRGDTAAEIMAAVMIRDADLSALPPGLNPRIADLIKRCLEKTPKNRWQSMGDLRVELETLAVAPYATMQVVAGAPLQPLWRRAIPIVATVVITAVVATLATRWLTQPPPADIVRFGIPSLNFASRFLNLAISPDGRRVAYVTANATNTDSQLMLRTIGDLEARPIAGTVGPVQNPAFSPDGQFVAYYSVADASLKRIPISGGAPMTLVRASVPFTGLSWGDSGLLFGQANGIHRVSANGGEAEVVVATESGQRVAAPQFVDKRGSILFTFTAAGWEKAQVEVQTPDRQRHVLVAGASDARAVATGHLIYAAGASLMAVPFDTSTHQVRGVAIPVVEGVARAGQQTWGAHYSVSGNGSLLYVPGAAVTSSARRRLALVDGSGKAEPLNLPAGPYLHPRVSPDGRRVVVGTDDGKEAAIWVYELSGAGPPRRLTLEGRNLAPIWTRDGRFITFQSDREGDRGLFQQAVDGTAPAERLTKTEPGMEHFPDSWSPDGKVLSLRALSASVSSIWTWSRGADGQPRPQLQGLRSYVTSEFSPNGQWLAYGSNEIEGRNYQVFVQPLPLRGSKYQVSPMTTSSPVWSRDGTRLFMAYTSRIYGVDVQTKPAFTVSQPVVMATPEILGSAASMRHFDVLPDGKRFLVVLPEGATDAGTQTPQINVVLNWFDELKAKAPRP